MSEIAIDIGLRRGKFSLSATFAAGPGITALTGPSGAGKSTVASAVAGLVRPERGRIEVRGQTLFDAAGRVNVPVADRRIGYVLQDALLFPHLSVRQNLTFSRRRGNLALGQVTEILGIAPLLERRPAGLSGGERQRVAIGRALLSGPSLLIMDEPLAGLDAARRAELLPFIETLRDTLSLPILYITHNWPEIIRLADTVVLMEQGEVRAAGPLQSILAAGDARLRHLVPDGSVIEATPTKGDVDGLCRFATAAGPLFLPRASVSGGKVRLFIDAHDVAIALEAPQGVSVQNVLSGTIEELAVLDESHLDLRLSLAGQQTIRARITRHAGAQLGLAAGMTVFALIKSVSFDRRLQFRGIE
ncbi:molybdenum ABC transporter ATP-binding protein [Emcibacter sp. SYSU 3D8]|uniref:molybdenum ABC transporter ATP-binding protein n=1 Tax=Emcibacter sp. SYSU 3D8 TaxID=3133969 RepID=UPI0031FF2E26